MVAVGKIEVDLFAARLFRQLLDAAEDAAFKIWRAEAVDSVVERARAIGLLRSLLAEDLEDVDLLGEVAGAILLLRLVRKRIV